MSYFIERFFGWMDNEPFIGLLMIVASLALFMGTWQRSSGSPQADSFWGWTRRLIAASAAAGLFLGVLWGFRALLNDNRRSFEQTHGRVSDANYQSLGTIWGGPHEQRELKVPALRNSGGQVICKPWPSRNGGRFTKLDFELDLANRKITCPAKETADISPKSLIAHFNAAACDACPLRAKCTTATPGRGRSVTIHEQEELLIELRQLKRTSEGREALRERVRVEHALARLGAIQGTRARYKGARRNELDVRRCAAVVNLQTVARLQRAA